MKKTSMKIDDIWNDLGKSWTLMKEIINETKVKGNTFVINEELTSDKWPLLLTWFNFDPSMDK